MCDCNLQFRIDDSDKTLEQHHRPECAEASIQEELPLVFTRPTEPAPAPIPA